MKTILIFLSLVAGTAQANQVFDPVADQQPVCFGREYGREHQKTVPLQTVQKIQAKLEKIDKYNQNNLSLEVTLKGARNEYINYRAIFTCNAANHCYIDCDGGKVFISMNDQGKLVVENKDFVLAGGCGSKAKTILLKATQGGDDIFELIKLPTEMCQNLVDYNK